MDSLFLLVPIALIFCAIAIKLFFWAIDSGQYDDLEKESRRVLFDEDPEKPDDDRAENKRLEMGVKIVTTNLKY